MHKGAIGYALGRLYQVLGLILLLPLAIAWYDYYPIPLSELTRQPEIFGFIVSVVLSLVLGTVMVLGFHRSRELGRINEGYAIVGIGWISMTFFTCLPLFFYLAAQYGAGPGNVARAFTDGYFEIMSGYTTTGATILSDIEAIPRSLLFLRAVSHWLGGMGIITLAIAIFPSIGVSAYAMFRGEVPGPSKDKLLPRLAQTTSILWGVYVLLTGVEAVLLWLGGMNLFDAVCHSFATMATGGFSTKGASIAAYHSDFIHWVVTIFMFLAGVNFVLHFQALRGEIRAFRNNSEFRFYASVVVGAVMIATLVLYFGGLDTPTEVAESYRFEPMPAAEFASHYTDQVERIGTFYGSFKEAAFQTVSIVTTTGFCTADFDLWPDFLRIMLVLLMFFGGCSSSTGGGMKMVRIMLVSRLAWIQLRRLSQPRLVAPVKLGGQVVDDNQIVNVVSFFILFTALFVVTALLMTLFVPDVITAVTASIATLGNIGPGLAGVGATQNYGWIPLPGKWILVLSMLLGRLEIFTILIILRPSVWRR